MIKLNLICYFYILCSIRKGYRNYIINLFLIYFLICGLIMYFIIDNFVKDLNKYDYEIPEHKRENISELRKMINCTFGTAFNSLVPCLYLI